MNRASVVKDLGVILDRKLSFKPHIDTVVNSAKRVRSFVKRQAREFNCPYVLKSLYCSLVRSKLEYCSVVWFPHFDCDKKRIESVQKQFLLFALRRLNWADAFRLPPYEARLSLLNLESLSDRRKIASCAFMVSQLRHPTAFTPPRWINSRTRYASTPRFQLPPTTGTSYGDNSPRCNAVIHFNHYAECYVPGISPPTYKRRIKAALGDEMRECLRARGY